jgi:hypothetical protein
MNILFERKDGYLEECHRSTYQWQEDGSVPGTVTSESDTDFAVCLAAIWGATDASGDTDWEYAIDDVRAPFIGGIESTLRKAFEIAGPDCTHLSWGGVHYYRGRK